MRHRRALIAADITHARLQQRLGDREDTFAAEHLAVAERELLHFLLERAFHGRFFWRLVPKGSFSNYCKTRLSSQPGQANDPARFDMLLENALNISLCKIPAHIEQPAPVLLRNLVGEAISEIERGGVKALAPASVGPRYAPRRGGRHT